MRLWFMNSSDISWYIWYIWYMMVSHDIYIYIGDDSLYGFWMDLNPNSVACRPWSQTISRLRSAHLPEDDQWQSESYFPYGRMGSADSALQWINHTFCLVSWVSCYIPHCIPRCKKIKMGGPSWSQLPHEWYPVTWKTSRLRDDKLPDLPLKKKASKSTCRRPLQFQVLVGLFRLVTSGGFLGTWRPSVMAELWLKVYPTGQDHAMKCGFQVVTPRIWDNTCKTETEWDWLGKIHHV